MRLNWSRRSLLTGFSTISLVGLAGCTNRLGSNRGATDVVIHNEVDEQRTVDLIVTHRDTESSSIDTSLELKPNTGETINNKVIMGSDYDVEVTVTDTTTESPYTETQEWNDAGDSLHVILDEQIVFAVQIG